jgi:signal transduction histidine kinase
MKPMRLTHRLALAFLLVVGVVFASHVYLSISWHADLFRADSLRDQHVMGKTLAGAVGSAWRDYGREAALAVVEEANQREAAMQIRWVALGSDQRDAPTAPPDLLERIRRGEKVVHIDGGRVHSYFPLRPAPLEAGALEISEPLSAGQEYVLARVLRAALTGLAMTVIAGLVSVLLGERLVGQPVRILIDKARRIGHRDFSAPLEIAGAEEFRELARGMNAMARELDEAGQRAEAEAAAREAATEQLRRSDRLAAVGRLASSLAHELGTPLNVVSERAKMIAAGEVSDPAELERDATIIREQSLRMTRIVRQLLDYVRIRSPDKAATNLGDLAHSTLAILEPLAEQRKVTLRSECPAPVIADVDPGQLQQALMNLVMNAIDATGEGRAVTVRVTSEAPDERSAREGGAASWAVVSVEDEGSGIAEELLAHVFDPFFTTKPVGEGTGLGLAVTDGIVREHSGRIDVRSGSGEGSCFSMRLPLGRGSEGQHPHRG